MGVDGIKSKPATNLGAAAEVAAPALTEVAPPPEPAPAAPTEGFDVAKKKLVSTTGTQRPYKPQLPTREDLKELVNSARSAINAGVSGTGGKGAPKSAKIDVTDDDGNLKDAALDTAASKGAAPAARDASVDFVAQAKAANPKATPAEIETAAAKLAKDKLEADFKVKVKDGDKPWTAEELTRTYEGFSNLPVKDRAALEGLDVVRDAKASAKSQAEMGDKGTVAGEYMPNVKTTDGVRDQGAAIHIYDAAFSGSRQDSIHVVTHEAGHAVEGRKRDEALATYNSAVDKSNKAVEALNTTVDPNNDQWKSTNAAAKDFGTISTDDKPGMAFLNAQNGVMNAVQKVQNAKTPEALAKAQTELDAAKTKRDKALGGLSGHDKEDAAKSWASETDAQEKTARAYADANVVYTGLKADTDAKMKSLKDVASVTPTTGDDGKPKLDTTSKELSAFSKARGTEKAVSGYGATKPSEEYAEAYALYQRDPAAMKKDFPKQYKFFHDNHLSPLDK